MEVNGWLMTMGEVIFAYSALLTKHFFKSASSGADTADHSWSQLQAPIQALYWLSPEQSMQ